MSLGHESELLAPASRQVRELLAGDVVVWQWHVATDRLEVRSGLAAALGRSDQDCPTHLQDWFSLIDPLDRDQVVTEFEAFLKTGGDRYDWLYSDEELHEWVGRIRDLDRMTGKTFVFFNNCHAGQAVRGAKPMQQLLGIPLTGEEAPTLEL